MGRIKTALIKRVTHDLLRAHRKELKKDFDENKVLVEQFLDVRSKKMRNVIAGYVTRLMKRSQEI